MSAQLKTLLPQRRNTFIVIALLLVLGTALGLYYFYYVPANRQRLHQYGFRILGAISRNMVERNNDLVRLYNNNISGEYRNTPIRDTDDISRGLATLPVSVRPVFIEGDVQRNPDAPGSPTVVYMRNNVLEYQIEPGKGIYVKLQLPADKLIKPIISYRHELFDNYLIIKRDSTDRGVVYQDDSLGIDNRVEPDSLLARNATTFSHIASIEIQGVQYKLFCFPFVLGTEHLVLGGLIKASDYRKRIGSIPVYLVYPLIIVLLLILISLPFLKIYLMGPYEQIRFTDLAGLGLAVFGGVTVVTMIIIQVLLLARGYVSASRGLHDLSRNIEQAMEGEIRQMQRQLRFLDTTFRRAIQKEGPADSVPGASIGVYGRDSNRHYRIPLFPPDGRPYYNFERVNWVGRSGMQHWRLQVPDTSRVFLINVKERDYFKFFQQQYNGREDTTVSLMDPVYSWSGGDFVINLVERSRIDTLLLLTFSAKMYSLLNPVLPPGYGFCVIDNRGRVYIHSEAERSLKENFLDETDNAGALRDAINSRQDTTLNSVHCYGKEHTLYIHPLSQRLVMHPMARRSFFLVTFYNNAYVAPVNLRILVFSLVFTFLTFLLLLLWLAGHHGFSRRSLLYRDPLAARFTWIIPRSEHIMLYRNGVLFLSAYLFVILAAGVFGRLFDDYVTFALGLVSPLNLLILLYAYRIYSQPSRDARFRWKMGFYLLFMFIYSLFIYRRLGLGSSPDGYYFWLFQSVLLLLLAGMLLRTPRQQPVEAPRVRPDYLLHYSGFVLLLALCLGVLPMMVFTWYAHNREIEQSLKKQQLCMAMMLEKRRPVLLNMVRDFRKVDSRVKAYYARRCWQEGIYGAGGNRIVPISPWRTVPLQGMPAPEGFYSKIAAYIDVEYNDPFRYPVLHQAADGAWYWEPADEGLALHYMLPPGTYPDSVQAIRISMPFQQRYLFLSGGDHITLLLISVALVLGGLFILIRSTVSRVFLLDFVRLFSRPSGECPEVALQTDEEVRALILAQRQQGAMFRSRWNRLSGRQKIILLDLVTDGLANYRNVMEISAMTGEEGLLDICEGVIVVKDPVFRQFILEQRLTAETVSLRKLYQARSLWESLRTPLLVAVVATGLFIFLTQEDISKKLLVLLTTLSTLLPLLPKLLNFRGVPPAKGEAT